MLYNSDGIRLSVMQVIKTEITVGKGITSDPARALFQYWDMDGKLLFTVDTCKMEKEHMVREEAEKNQIEEESLHKSLNLY